MRLESSTGASVRLSIVGYQYPGMTPAPGSFDWDANWLVVDGRASDARGEWTFNSACLQTNEARSLAAWLEAAADGKTDLEPTDFIEPVLEFRSVSSPSQDPVVRVIFRLEAQPQWARDEKVADWDAVSIDIDEPPDALRKAADELREELHRYPVR